jgi:hypothetical protein
MRITGMRTVGKRIPGRRVSTQGTYSELNHDKFSVWITVSNGDSGGPVYYFKWNPLF